tara:strand:+ start:227 stop:1060 length:834 start_codon:yes stop_codon:yes gene_type:complete
MKSGIVIGHNAGLGDMIIMNGAIRYLATKYDEVHVITWAHNAPHINFVYRDCENIRPYFMPPPKSTRQAILRMHAGYQRIVELNPHISFEPYKQYYYSSRHHWHNLITQLNLPSDIIWPRMFYHILQVPYEKRYSEFNITRDHAREDDLLKKLNLPEKYAFACDNISSHRYNIKKWETSLPIINPDDFNQGYGPLLGDSLIFDWRKVIENASEIHTVDTCWLHLARMARLQIPTKKYYKVRKVRLSSSPDYLNDEYDSGWSIVVPKRDNYTSRPQDK